MKTQEGQPFCEKGFLSSLYGESEETGTIPANLGNRYFRDEERSNGRALTKWLRNGAHAQARINRSTEVPETGTV